MLKVTKRIAKKAINWLGYDVSKIPEGVAGVLETEKEYSRNSAN